MLVSNHRYRPKSQGCVWFSNPVFSSSASSQPLFQLAYAPLPSKPPSISSPSVSQYALSIDSKNYPPLSNIFTNDLVAQYPYPPPPNNIIQGATGLQRVLESQLHGVVMQHSISTTVVDFSGTDTPNSTAYLIATYLGQGNLIG